MSLSSEISGTIEEHKDIVIKPSLSQTMTEEQQQIKPQMQTKNAPSSDITLGQRMLSACAGSLLTSLVVTPFDVVRIRMQQQELLYPKGQTPVECCKKVFWEGDPQEARSVAELESLNCLKNTCSAQENKINGTFSGISKIASSEGLPSLYRGLSLTLIMAVPSNVVYFSGYEFLRDSSPIAQTYPILNPLVCGAFARIIAATTVAPLELLKTRLQAVPARSHQSSSDIMKMVLQNSYNEIKSNGLFSMFKGLQLTLWRDA
ncbi:unnamed protein product [Ambrosiozyma monospora]|uniref:Unnamed protein product n=1 Tax=Ambrosiozyma monospora TaxID=43982 RepID=A0ACB5U6H4_AMBMO|nr:unnamed protein product [Ambrosiozyma monospora]